MANRFVRLPDTAGRRRLWIMYHVAFGLLLVHFLWVHLSPDYYYATQSDWSQAFAPIDQQQRERVIERSDGRYLWGGDDESWHFDISEFRLDPAKLHHGIGRERFPALIEPRFDLLDQADDWLADDDRVLVLELGDEVRVYPIELLIRHEVVNDVVNDVPVFAAYCILADLGAVYDRRIAGHTFTFALSGYTYADPDIWDGMNMFILWDRETESLWYPGTGRAVSGLMLYTPLPLIDHEHWSQTTWGRVKDRYDRAHVLRPGQDMDPPKDWPRLTAEDLAEAAAEQARAAREDDPVHIAPRWGGNPDVGG